jgi:signal peptidase I
MARTAKPPHRGVAQTKETLGSFIFALVLALVFMRFVGQAFVIPTGSMAPTLLGRHVDHVCSSCGYRFAVGMDRPPTRVVCPNCGYEDLLTQQPIADAGDGIFTLSWPFAVGGPLSPKRWEVVVFKAPFRIPFAGPDRDGETNYIKRLIGMPGDVIEIVDGDVYACRAAELSQTVRAKLAHTPLPERLTEDERTDLDNRLQIVRKPPQAQDALWELVFDADYPPTKPAAQGANPAFKPAGNPGRSAWTVDGRIFRFNGAAGRAEFLELTGKDFHDTYGYNAGGGWQQIVSDLRLAATVNWHGGDGAIRLCLSKFDDLYTVELRPADGTGRATRAKRATPQDQQELKSWSQPVWKHGQPVQVSFANADRRLEVRINNQVVWQQDLPMTAALAKQHRYETQSPIVRIGAADLKATFTHLLVNRDVYYQDVAPIVTLQALNETLTRRVYNEYSDRPGWATRDNPMLLRQTEYFVLGDNSPASLDSRRWWQTGAQLADRPDGFRYRPGTVPADQMIGQAFFVYWPSWYRPWNIPGLRVIPNIGEMRWIH